MNKKVNGYMTVEASLIIPLVLCIYVAVIKLGFLIYDRCVMSQDQYLAVFRSSRFTLSEEAYGEVIYGNYDVTEPDLRYAEERTFRKQKFYPMFGKGEVKTTYEYGKVQLWGKGFEGLLEVKKEAVRNDIFAAVRKRRQKKDGS